MRKGNLASVRCPRCRQEVPAGTPICDNCNEILDASFFDGADDAPVQGERTDVGPAPTQASQGRRDLRPARLTQRGGWSPKAGAPAPAAAERRPYLAPPPAPPPLPVLDEANRTAGDLATFFRNLQPADRLASLAATALLLTLALPWKWTKREDEIIGLVAAWPLALLGAGVLALIYRRALRADAQRSRQLKLAQAACAVLTAGLAGLFLPYATEQKTVRAMGLMVTLPQSRPELGAYLGLVCAMAMMLASVSLALGDRQRQL